MPGVPLLTAQLGPNARLIVEAAWGADLTASSATWTWTDITADVRQANGQKVTITQGRGDETSQAQPASCTFQLDNTTGDYTPNNPASVRYPNVRRNTPIRVSVDLGTGGGPVTRFFGFANGFTPSWDISAQLAVVSVSASGKLRQLMQGKSPIRSPLYRAISARTDLRAYWPMEDNSGSTQISSGIPSGQALVGIGLTFASESSEPGSAPLPKFGTASSISAQVVGSFSNRWQVDWYYKLPTDPTPNQPKILRFFTTDFSGSPGLRWDITVGGSFAGAMSVYATNSAGAQVVSSPNIIFGSVLFGQWLHVGLMAQQSGGNIQWQVVVVALQGIPSAFGSTVAGTIGVPYTVDIPADANLNNLSMGHLAVYDAYNNGTVLGPEVGFVGEKATDRLTRLGTTEQGVPVTITGTTTTTMGPQSVDIFMNLLRESETVDAGVLYDGFSNGLGYITNSARYNQPAALTLDMAAGQVDDPFAPVDDDQRNRNLVKVDRKSGSSATYEDKTGPLGTNAIGTYDNSLTVNVQTDGVLLDRASWEVHKGTVEGLWYPNLNLDFVANPSLLPAWLATKLNSRIDVTNVSSKALQHPPGTVSLLLEGYTESLSPFEWKVSPANCSPYDPYRVFKLDDTALGRLDTSGANLTAGVSAGATSLTVQTTKGPTWITTATLPAQFPLDVNAGGRQVTTTAIANVTPSLVGVGATAAGNATSVTPALPAGIQAGDVLLCFAGTRNDAAGTTNVPSGWTLLVSINGTARLFGKVATGGDTAPTVTFSGLVAGDTTLAQCAAFRNVTMTTKGLSTSGLNASAQNIAYPTQDVPANCLVLYLGWKQTSWTSVATIAGATEIGEPSSALGGSMGLVWDYVFVTSSATIPAGSFTVTGGVAAISRGAVVALDAGNFQTFTVNPVPGAIAANAVVKVWKPGVLAL